MPVGGQLLQLGHAWTVQAAPGALVGRSGALLLTPRAGGPVLLLDDHGGVGELCSLQPGPASVGSTSLLAAHDAGLLLQPLDGASSTSVALQGPEAAPVAAIAAQEAGPRSAACRGR